MKKALLPLWPLLMVTPLHSCTLSRDEYILPEEERGVEEAYTDQQIQKAT